MNTTVTGTLIPLTMRTPSLLIFTFVSLLLHAQTGPGGVGNSSSNIVWLDASSGVSLSGALVTSWGDRSGNNNTAVQAVANRQPTYVANSMNGHPVIHFDDDAAAADYLRAPDNATLEGMSGLTGFCVYQLADGTPESIGRGILSKRVNADNQEAYSWFLYNGGGVGTNRNQYLDIDGAANRMNSSPTSFATNTVQINSFEYNGTAPSDANDQRLFSGNTGVGNAVESSTSVPNYTSDLYIGLLNGHAGSRFNGVMGEVIMYNYALGSAQRIIVNNYLAAKYGTTLASNDLYVEDNAGNGNYDHDVAGIGRISSTDLQTDSRGSGIVEISGATNLDNNEFLLWGHDNGGLFTAGTTDYPAGLQGRWNRVWRNDQVTTAGAEAVVGAVDITFHLQGLNIGSLASSLRLLIDANNNGVFADDTPIGGAVFLGGGGRYQFPGVTALTNGLRFTLGTTDLNTSLPIELLAFNATPVGEKVLLEWATATEQDNDHFTIERSSDGHGWEDIGQLPGAGNSVSWLSYNFDDRTPLGGMSYYRLRQTDNDGSSTWSSTVAVRIAEGDGTVIFPNPNNGVFAVVHPGGAGPVELLSVGGQAVPVRIDNHDDRSDVIAPHLPEGMYFVRTGPGADAVLHRVIVSHTTIR
jgi:hypothetical protein